ncbi:MAG TPA: T9SS type A sorting domain-containing protein, partial [Chitinophagaceae bacterium]|nr:T9SS type A sorting domain-containing protein [Chitinophagaceae bacterium]
EIKKSTDTVWQQYNGANNLNYSNDAVFKGIHGVNSVIFDMKTGPKSVFGHISVVDITIISPNPSPGFSNIQSLSLDSNLPVDGRLKIAPDPVESAFNLLLNDHYTGNFYISVINMSGQVIWKTQVYKEDGEFRQLVNAASWPGGMYLLSVGENGMQETIKFIKQ